MYFSKFWLSCIIIFLVVFYLSIAWGGTFSSPSEVFRVLISRKPESYEQASILYQRFPRAMIAIYAGLIMASSGLVFQGLIRNPLASASSLGVNAGATLFVVGSALIFEANLAEQGSAALLGGLFGFLLCTTIAKIAGVSEKTTGLMLILSGSLTTMLLIGLSNALLLSYADRRSEFLSWIAGNINHAYIDRLYEFWWIGLIALVFVFLLSKPLTLILLGNEKASSMGVRTVAISRFAMACAIVASCSATAVCGPISFIGLIVPHMVKPLVGQDFRLTLPASALIGAILCLLASSVSQNAFQPYVVNTGIILDLFGGIVFILLIRKFYVSPQNRRDI
ncbi:ABC transporter [Bartonella choladocola]|uniref:FecCD family ABC transporter permease n=1 Tax=Bartonella choladocola TaxID=2750995 RepID=UPI0039976CF3